MLEADPVCGLDVQFDAQTKINVPKTQHDGKYYYFCSQDCKLEFDADPEEYATSDD